MGCIEEDPLKATVGLEAVVGRMVATFITSFVHTAQEGSTHDETTRVGVTAKERTRYM